MNCLETSDDIAAGVAALLRIEPRFATVVASHGLPPLRRMPGGLAGLFRIVTDQLISLQAGAAIWRRVAAELDPFDPRRIAACDEARLMRLGLSAAKARCFRAVAAAVDEGRLDFAALAERSDAEALETLIALPGIGPWTADIYLLSAMGRTDAWPAGDLALRAAAHDLFALPQRPAPRHLVALAEPWRPWRAVAARLLWSHYRGLKGMAQQTP